MPAGWSAASERGLANVVILGQAAEPDTDIPVARGRALTADDALGPALDALDEALGPESNKKCVVVVSIVGSACISGIPALVQYLILTENGGLDTPCDVPIPWWLASSAIMSLAIGATLVVLGILTLSCGKSEAHGQYVKKPAFVFCLERLICMPACMFYACWYIKGNIWVWGTHPYNSTALTPMDITTSSGLLDKGVGCEPGLLQGSRVFLIVTYTMPGVIMVLICLCMCGCICGLARRGWSEA